MIKSVKGCKTATLTCIRELRFTQHNNSVGCKYACNRTFFKILQHITWDTGQDILNYSTLTNITVLNTLLEPIITLQNVLVGQYKFTNDSECLLM